MEYSYRAYCDICNDPSEWFDSSGEAMAWRSNHFRDEHEDNPMRKQNCRIQRDTVDVVGCEPGEWEQENSTAEEIFNHDR